MTTLRLERVYPHDVHKLWRALTERELISRWLMPTDFEPKLGHRFNFHTDPGLGFDGVVHCEVTEIEPPRRLAYTWRGGPIDTLMTFTLEVVSTDPPATRLVIEQSGFRGLKAWLVSRILKHGNRKIFDERLPRLLDQLEREPRTSA